MEGFFLEGESKEKKPPALSTYTLKLKEVEIGELKAWCHARSWTQQAVPYARFAFKGKVSLVMYESGKLVVQGSGTEDFVRDVLEPYITKQALLGYEEVHHPEWFQPHAGLDESGKGDVFGPLVSACVVADGEAVRSWLKAGVRDCKSLSDGRVMELAKVIYNTPHTAFGLLAPSLESYNRLYNRFKNLNRLLAWQHAKSLEEALEKKRVPWGLLDEFSKRPLVLDYFKDPSSSFVLKQKVRAESDPVVAAASILARHRYLKALQELSERCGQVLPKGAGDTVPAALRALMAKEGREALKHFAKLHFKTVSQC